MLRSDDLATVLGAFLLLLLFCRRWDPRRCSEGAHGDRNSGDGLFLELVHTVVPQAPGSNRPNEKRARQPDSSLLSSGIKECLFDSRSSRLKVEGGEVRSRRRVRDTLTAYGTLQPNTRGNNRSR